MCREFPGLLDDIRIWFRDYKKPDGKPENKFGFDDQWQNKEYTLKVYDVACHISHIGQPRIHESHFLEATGQHGLETHHSRES